jgi:hypothetical protein
MNAAGRNSERIDNSGARQFELNVEVSEKPVEALAADHAQTRGQVGGEQPRETAQKQQDEKLDLWMRNIKEFIRNIDVKSL